MSELLDELKAAAADETTYLMDAALIQG